MEIAVGNGEVARVVGLWLLLLPSHSVTAVLGVPGGSPGSFLGPAASALPLGARLCPLQVAGRFGGGRLCFPSEDGLPTLGQEEVHSSRPPTPTPTHSDAGEAFSRAALVTSGRVGRPGLPSTSLGQPPQTREGSHGQESSLT